MERLRAEREEGREQHLEAVDGAESDVEDRGGAVAVGLEQRPGLLLARVLVRERGEPHRLGEAGLEAGLLDQPSDGVEAAVDGGEERLVLGGERPGLGDGAEGAVRARERAVDEVPPRRDELVVVAAHELGPGEVGVLRLGPGDREEVAERVGVVAARGSR